MFKELDMLIQDMCSEPLADGPDDFEMTINTARYESLKLEINEHIQGTKKLHELSKDAQSIMLEWEREENELRGVKNVNEDTDR